jgi:uncharacterized LabA/DUF88 family protein
MERNAVFVDAGYLYAQSSICLSGSKLNRPQLKLNEAEIINQLKSIALTRSAGKPLLRIYWYDGAKNGMTVDHITLANMEDVKVRLGSINSAGEQKGVDSLLVTDLIDLARNQSISDAMVVTGDGDLRIAVQIAQTFGVRVHLVTLEPSRVSLSALLRQEADTVSEIPKADVAKFMQIVTVPAIPVALTTVPAGAAAPMTPASAIQRAIDSILGPLSPEDAQKLKLTFDASNTIPTQYDRRLLGTARSFLGRDLSGDERRTMRTAFVNQASS